MFHALLTLLNNSSVKSSTRTVLISSQKNTTWHQIKTDSVIAKMRFPIISSTDSIHTKLVPLPLIRIDVLDFHYKNQLVANKIFQILSKLAEKYLREINSKIYG